MPKQCNCRADKVLELIHSDICGPITLISSSEALSRFKEFKVMVEKESGAPVKCLRTNIGGEYMSTGFIEFCKEHGIKRQLTTYMSTGFIEFCKEHGIKRQLTTAYTPHHNGVAERRNRTIMNIVRSMLSTKEMPRYLWTEAVVRTVYVLNKCPTLSVKDKTPQEAWSGTKPTVEHLKVWGCVAYAHVPKIQRSKQDKRSITCVFLGMSSGTKGNDDPQESEELRWEENDMNEALRDRNEVHDDAVER
ncbi:hypothetical protein LIER_20935 [Lithospermum erythrorhizon]|uniref:Integrase catalytic domain-containing protein n=1 Tax=Lithospermum erythrorhizon TaxID=34254 RepID=A0AAV3QNA9_LITER